MKKIILVVALAFLAVAFVGCDVTYKVQNDDSILITLECDEDDVDEVGEMFDFDSGDLDNLDDVEDVLDDLLDESPDVEGEFVVKSFKKKNDDFTFVVKYTPTDDIDDGIASGIVVGNAEEVMDEFANVEYDEDFDDVYDEDMADDIDDEIYYAFAGDGEELSDKEFEDYFDKAKLSKYKALYMEADDDTLITVPGKIRMIISDNDDIDIDGKYIEAESDVIVIYGGAALMPWVLILVMIALVAVGLGLYFFVFKKPEGEDTTLEEEFEIDAQAE